MLHNLQELEYLSKLLHEKLFIYCPIATKISKILWALIVILLTKHELLFITLTHGIHLLSMYLKQTRSE